MTKLDYKILREESELDALATEWRALHARVGNSPYTDYNTFMTWWRILGKQGGRRLHVIAGFRNGKLAAMLPLAVITKRGIRILQDAGAKVFHYCDALCDDAEQLKEMWRVARRSPHYDFAAIRDVFTESPCFPALTSFATRRDKLASFYTHNKWASGQEWLAALPGRTRRDHVRYMRRLEQKGPVRFETCIAEPLPQHIIEDMVKQKVSWATTRSKKGLFENGKVMEFFRTLLAQSAKEERLYLTWLVCEERPIAYFLWLKFKGTLWGSTVTYDPEWAYYSPGNIVLAHSIMWAFDNGLKTVWIGNGEVEEKGGSYKSKFATETRECVEFSFSHSLKGRLLEKAFYTARDLSRKLKEKKSRPKKKGDSHD